MFVVTYFCITLGVLISTVQAALLANQPERAMRLDRFAGRGLPALFFALIALCKQAPRFARWQLRSRPISTQATYSFSVASYLFLRLRFTERKWGTFGEVVH
jgi:hypothetical protein